MPDTTTPAPATPAAGFRRAAPERAGGLTRTPSPTSKTGRMITLLAEPGVKASIALVPFTVADLVENCPPPAGKTLTQWKAEWSSELAIDMRNRTGIWHLGIRRAPGKGLFTWVDPTATPAPSAEAPAPAPSAEAPAPAPAPRGRR